LIYVLVSGWRWQQLAGLLHLLLSSVVSDLSIGWVFRPMCICCCLLGWHRHKVHLLSYGMVATLLMGIGIAFSIFAMFQKNSQIGKIWLAGPTTFTVGLVLCGKVVIDWGPAQLDSRSESDNQLQSSSTVSYHICAIDYCSWKN
jgi:hypothetical protein